MPEFVKRWAYLTHKKRYKSLKYNNLDTKIGTKEELAAHSNKAAGLKRGSLRTPQPSTYTVEGRTTPTTRRRGGQPYSISRFGQSVTTWLNNSPGEGQRSQRVQGVCVPGHGSEV